MAKKRLRIRRGTSELWTERNPILRLGEMGYETDTVEIVGGVHYHKFKLGNGTDAWVDLPYAGWGNAVSSGGGGTVAWADITGKPTEFAPSAHTHAWADVTDKPTAFNPSAHSHDWSEVTGKPSTFAPSSHTHGWSEITGKPSAFNPTAHSHEIADINGLEDALLLTKSTDGSFYLVICPASVTRYLPLFGGFTGLQSNPALVQMSVNERQEISNFRLTTNTVQSFTGEQRVIIQVNGVDTGTIITIPASAAAGVFTSDKAITLEVGDTVSLKVVNLATLVGAQLGGITYTRQLLP